MPVVISDGSVITEVTVTTVGVLTGITEGEATVEPMVGVGGDSTMVDPVGLVDGVTLGE